MSRRNSNPPEGIVQRLLALFSPKETPHRSFRFDPQDVLQDMRPRAATSPPDCTGGASYPEIPEELLTQKEDSLGTQEGKFSLSPPKDSSSTDRLKVEDGYKQSGAKPKKRVSLFQYCMGVSVR